MQQLVYYCAAKANPKAAMEVAQEAAVTAKNAAAADPKSTALRVAADEAQVAANEAANRVAQHSGQQPELVPMVAYVQRLARLRPTGDASVGSNLLLEYIQSEYRDDPETSEMLQQAFEMRTLIVLLDGVDEAAGLKEVNGPVNGMRHGEPI